MTEPCSNKAYWPQGQKEHVLTYIGIGVSFVTSGAHISSHSSAPSQRSSLATLPAQFPDTVRQEINPTFIVRFTPNITYIVLRHCPSGGIPHLHSGVHLNITCTVLRHWPSGDKHHLHCYLDTGSRCVLLLPPSSSRVTDQCSLWLLASALFCSLQLSVLTELPPSFTVYPSKGPKGGRKGLCYQRISL